VKWYLSQGNILVNSMILWSLMPMINFILDWTELKLERIYDSWHSTPDHPTTR